MLNVLGYISWKVLQDSVTVKNPGQTGLSEFPTSNAKNKQVCLTVSILHHVVTMNLIMLKIGVINAVHITFISTTLSQVHCLMLRLSHQSVFHWTPQDRTKIGFFSGFKVKMGLGTS